MGKVKLMNRTDTKFVTSYSKILELLKEISHNYMVQEIEGKRNMPYATTYYDTLESDMYYQHHRGKKTRQKVRTRIYEGTMEFPFLEIKHKNNKGRTKKKRILMEGGEAISEYSEFVRENSNYNLDFLNPVLNNHFFRITLVNFDMTERITIDTSIEFFNIATGNQFNLPNIGIIEWKKDGRNCNSGLQQKLRELHIHQSGFSKYVVGMALTNNNIPQNRLKPKIRKILSIK